MPRMKADDFANALKEKFPELAKFNNTQIINQVLARRPDLTDKIENPLAGDAEAAQAQQKTLNQQQQQLAPARSMLGTLPAIGAIAGSIYGGPALGGGLGAGAGQGLRDLTEQILGINNTSPTEKALNIGKEGIIAGVTPGLMEAIAHPLDAIKTTARGLSGVEDAFIPSRLRPWLKPPIFDKLAEIGNKVENNPLARPPNRAFDAEIVEPKVSEPSFQEGEIVPPRQITSGSRFITRPNGATLDTKITSDELNKILNDIMTRKNK